jgi:hypothetical protein
MNKTYNRWNFTELLIESIADIMGRICTYDENRIPDRRQLDGKRTAARSLSHTSFAPNENPSKTLLV